MSSTVTGKSGQVTSSANGETLSETIHQHKACIEVAATRMRAAGLPDAVITNFELLFNSVLCGHTGVINEHEIEPVSGIDCLDSLSDSEHLDALGRSLLPKLAVIRLNGGLGTTMGLARAKSLLAVRGELTFNDIIAQQLIALRNSTGVAVPLLHMTSFSTDGDVRHAMQRYPDLTIEGIAPTFLQHKHPKIYQDDFSPACEEVEDLNWNPPGHGDIYAALLASGLAEALVARGKRYLFVANADNLGATVDLRILGYLASKKAPFLMETAERTPADSKGGHLARSKETGALLLRESGQCPLTPEGDLIPEFRDISRHRHFNTNNIWLDLEAVIHVARTHGGCIPLPLISNKKSVNPRDRESRRVIQIETAMGAAIGVFNGATALQVPRSRFAPVKSNNDLLVVRSDAYALTESGHLVRNPKRSVAGLPLVSLDPRYYSLISDFEQRFKVVPSLVEATSFSVVGDVVFNHGVTIEGSVSIVAEGGEQRALPEDTVLVVNSKLLLDESCTR